MEGEECRREELISHPVPAGFSLLLATVLVNELTSLPLRQNVTENT